MSREIEIVYSQQHTDFVKGKAYSNPRYFTTPRNGVKKVYLVGSWPKIEKAYKAIGVPVEYLDENMKPISAPEMAQEAENLPQQKDYSHVEIPDTWRDLPWVGADSIRTLATKLTDEPVLNKAQAVAVITAELAKRGPVEPHPPLEQEPSVAEGAGEASMTASASGESETTTSGDEEKTE